MQLGLGLGLTYQRGGSAAPSLNDQMQDRLAGTAGYALDIKDLTKLWKDAGVTPVAANADPIGRWQSKFGTNTYNFDQASAGNQPAWDSAGALVSATDDSLRSAASYAMTASMNTLLVSVRALVTSLAIPNTLFGFSTNGASTIRTDLLIGSDGAISWRARRANADGLTTLTTAAGLIVTGTPFTLQLEADYLTTGSMEIFLNGVSVATGTMAGTPGVSDATNSARASMASNLTSDNFWNGRVGNFVFDRGGLGASPRALGKAYVESAGV